MYIDLHVHLRGTITPIAARRLARRNNLALPEGLISGSSYQWHDFSSFLSAYDAVASVVTTGRDYEEVAYEYLKKANQDRTIYVEFMISPRSSRQTGIQFTDQLVAIDAAADRALEDFGIECRVIATAVRHLGPTIAIESARAAEKCTSRRLVGFGLTGDERRFDAAQFQEAFRIASNAGLKTTAHAGEYRDAHSVLETAEKLSLHRIGHGTKAASCPNTLESLSKLKISIEVCITSNLRLGVVDFLGAHPVRIFDSQECSFAIGTDDPAFFGTTAAKEYALVKQICSNFDDYSISKAAIDAAFCDEGTKSRLRAKLSEQGRRGRSS